LLINRITPAMPAEARHVSEKVQQENDMMPWQWPGQRRLRQRRTW